MFLQQPFPSDEEGLPDSEVAQKILKHLTKDKIFNKRYAWLLDNELDWPKLWTAKGGGFKAYCDGLRKRKGHVNDEMKKKMACKCRKRFRVCVKSTYSNRIKCLSFTSQ